MCYKPIILYIVVQLITKVNPYEYGKGTKQPFRSDYEYFESTQSYYKLHTVPQTWFEAKKTCVSEGASLFYPEDQNETALGLHRKGRPLLEVFNKWDTDEPNNFNDQDCVILERNHTIGDYWCARQFPFFCKKKFELIDWKQHCIVTGFDGSQQRPFFRKDYLCSPTTQSFYKFHTIHRLWSEAKEICANEGATLFYPEDKYEADTVLAYMKQTYTFKWIHVGISDLKTEGVFETVDGRSIKDVYDNWDVDQPNNKGGRENCIMMRDIGTLTDETCDWSYPFLCKKTMATLEWNFKCNMPYLDYVYDEKLRRCYKFHSSPKNWTDAHAVCVAEESYLAVINSKKEADYLARLTAQYAPTNTKGIFVQGAVLLGFHNQLNEGWTTVKANSLLDGGYTKWAFGQPDGVGRDKCGSMFYDGGLNDVGCDQKAFFICEHEVPLTETSFIADRIDN